MARFRKSRRRGSFRISRRSRRSSSNVSPVKLAIATAIYGAARPTIANIAAPVTNMIPAGQYSDNLVLGAVGYIASKKGGLVGTAGKAILFSEAFLVGSAVMGSTGSSSNFGAWS